MADKPIPRPAHESKAYGEPQRPAKKVGKPLKFTDERRNIYLKALESGIRPVKAAKAAGVSPQTVSVARRADPDLDQACADAEIVGLTPIEDKLYELAEAGDLLAIKTVLYNRNKDRWKDMRHTQTDVNVKHTQELEVGDRLSRVMLLQARLAERKAIREPGAEPPELSGGTVIDAEVVEE